VLNEALALTATEHHDVELAQLDVGQGGEARLCGHVRPDDDVDVRRASGVDGEGPGEVPGEAEVVADDAATGGGAVARDEDAVGVRPARVDVRGVGSDDDATPGLGARREPPADERAREEVRGEVEHRGLLSADGAHPGASPSIGRPGRSSGRSPAGSGPTARPLLSGEDGTARPR
jgi:hypothetical protein